MSYNTSLSRDGTTILVNVSSVKNAMLIESGLQGPPGISGYSGYSGYSGINGSSGFSGYSGISGYSGQSITDHQSLTGLDSLNAHPITSIINLQSVLESKFSKMNFVHLGDVTDCEVSPTTSNDIIYYVNLIGNGNLTIHPAGINEYAGCLLVVTSSGGGAYSLNVLNSVRWLNGTIIDIAPLATEVIHLYIQSINQDLFLTATKWK